MSHAAKRQDAEICVRDIGSFFVGGKLASLSGQPVREIKYAASAPPLKVDPNGTYVGGQAYVHYVRLVDPVCPFPVLFLNGGTSTGAMWETTPDGRPGWQTLFLRRGYDTFLTDACGKGRASYAPYPEILSVEPVFRPNEQTWRLLRVGPAYDADPAQRRFFPNSQFPIDHFDEYTKQVVPRFPGQDDLELSAYRELIERIGPAIIVAQSSGGYLATMLAAELPALIAAIVTIELTAVPLLDAINVDQLASVPQCIFWGDNWQETPPWPGIRSSVDDYVSAMQSRSCAIEIADLPSIGIHGNSHQMMLDRNSSTIFNVAMRWLETRLDAAQTG